MGIRRLMEGVLHDEELDDLLQTIDSDHSGSISRAEFEAFMASDQGANRRPYIEGAENTKESSA